MTTTSNEHRTLRDEQAELLSAIASIAMDTPREMAERLDEIWTLINRRTKEPA